MGLFQDSVFAGDLEGSKSTSGGTLCVFGSHTFVPISWMCKKQTCVSHSSIEAETISLDAGLRMDGIPALDLWDLVSEASHSDSNRKQEFKPERGNLSCNTQNSRRRLELSHVYFVLLSAKYAHEGTQLCIFEDNEAVIKMIMKGRSPNLRHVSRTHRVALDWLFDIINLDPKVQI